jgi:hypothetical protein
MGDAIRGPITTYQATGNSSLGSVIDNWYAATWGKPGTNPLPLIASPDGKYDIGFDSSGCTVNPTYPIFTNCGSNGGWLSGAPIYTSGKLFGQMFGISNQASWPVIRSGGALPSRAMAIYVSGRIQDVTRAVKMQVTVTEPTGVVDPPVFCFSSPCEVTVNQTIGNPTIEVRYLDADGKVLSADQPFTVNVQ